MNTLSKFCYLVVLASSPILSSQPSNPTTETDYSIGDTIIHRSHFEVIDSTQLWAEKYVSLDSTATNRLHLVTASQQTMGQATHGRVWISPIGNIYATLVFPVPPVSDIDAFPMTARILSAIAARKALSRFAPSSKIQVKWPNDVIADGGKISGALASVKNVAEFDECFLGVGINVNYPAPDGALPATDQPVTSLHKVVGHEFDKDEVLLEYLGQFVGLLTRYSESSDGFFPEFFANLAFKEEVVKVFDDETSSWVTGKMIGTTKEGFLKLETENGEQIIQHGTLRKALERKE